MRFLSDAVIVNVAGESAHLGSTVSAKKNRVVGRTDGGKIMFCAAQRTNHKKINK